MMHRYVFQDNSGTRYVCADIPYDEMLRFYDEQESGALVFLAKNGSPLLIVKELLN